MKKVFILVSSFLFTMLLSVSCEKDKNARLIQDASTKSTSALDLLTEDSDNPFVRDTNLYHLVRLTTVDNQLVKLYLKGLIDTTDVFAIYDELYIPENAWINENLPENASFDSFLSFIESNYSEVGLDIYFQDMERYMRGLSVPLLAAYSPTSESDFHATFMEAVQIIYSAYFKEEFILTKTRCDLCYSDYASCLYHAEVRASILYAGSSTVSMGLLYYAQVGKAFVAWAGGFLAGGLTQWAGNRVCARELNSCLRENDCPPPGGGGGGIRSGWGCLECIIKE